MVSTFIVTLFTNSVKNDDDENKIFKRCVVSLNPEYPEGFGFTLNSEIEPKFTIFTVETDSPAYAANLRASDVIVEIDKKNIRRSEFEKVKSMILQSKKNGSVEILAISKQAYLKLKSDGKKLSQNLATNENTLFFYDKKKIKKMNLHLCEFDVYEENLGFSVASLKSNPGIFRVTDVVPGSSAAISNLKDNDLIVEVSGTNVENLSYDDLIALLQKKKCERNLKILIRRD
ncbi:Na(+) H(+) exchange regulatory cofactor NHE-RF1 [Brachionus plicatilis]|uniref:Na(+) H(+) exchange regulatory cofactor NHE-RF1 n=1 Tax=Brachionus plicatilis TaxID=10195 RepID=A0A3M7Q3K6_BRAPC|nr:Na(+) H(+) exchange regulatory cofactor NHE-RF1 [Brachionus plicatilis]